MTDRRPNVLFILGESHAPDLLGALGNPFIKTPNLDKLAERGALFENAYCASPLCVPARAAIATGRYPHETGYWDSSMAYDGQTESWMKRLQRAGYETAGIGKMHYRRDDDYYGFDTFVETMHIADGIGDLISAFRHNGEEPTYEGLWKLWTTRYGAGDEDPYRQYDERIIAESSKWMADIAAKTEKPWALSVHPIAAHAPFIVPQQFLDLYDPKDIPPPVRYTNEERPEHQSIEHLRAIVCHEDGLTLEQIQTVRAHYFATISYLDHQVGRLLDTLEIFGLTETTQIYYTSDHGFSCGDHYIFGLFHLMEESVRVPLVMAGPGIPTGIRYKTPVSHVDLSPTILEACDPQHETMTYAANAESLWPILSGEKPAHGPVYAEYHGCCTLSGGFVLRDGWMKLIYFVGMEPQLFDLLNDPEEGENLAGDNAYSDVLASMIAKLREIADPESVDANAKAAQRDLVERFGGKEAVMEKMGGFAFSPPPGLKWQAMTKET